MKQKEEKKEIIVLKHCEYDPKTGVVECKVGRQTYEIIRKGEIIKEIRIKYEPELKE